MFYLSVARYRVFDWLAMNVMVNRINSESAVKVLVFSFLKCKGDVDLWIDDLRVTDYECCTNWQALVL